MKSSWARETKLTQKPGEIPSWNRPWNLTLRKRKVEHPPRIARGLRRGPLLRLLIEADYVAGGVAEPGSDFGGVGADGLDDFALVGEDGVEGGGHAVARCKTGGRAWRRAGVRGIYDFRLAIYDLRNSWGPAVGSFMSLVGRFAVTRGG